ncbi:c-type cytochrome [Albimonas sp. CAU 1670]|uniref:c-type cytochrome n=1 Tax=Albimonas sp. CAU 1670 TaxID=3032599 RepID=UPI0023D98537|nr:c-type cytochrome [Albimonas sp. CAU 1670]MDF2235146.1 c-type cytochrome [Albimonas sp. CAU 1670]
MLDRTVTLRALLIAALIAAAAGAAAFWLGLAPIGAAGGHSKLADWVLHTAMRRAVAFHAMGTEVPDLSAPGLVRLGAGHYESGCAPCHGSPAAPSGGAARTMLPKPPDLAERIDDWTPAQLHWIVDQGVMMTGMPAWPARHREDEVWPVVAFLQALPGMDAGTYRALAYGAAGERARGLALPAAPPRADCARCHGPDGAGPAEGGLIPRLDIQPEAALRAALESYAEGARASGIMGHAVAGLDAQTLAQLAADYAAAPMGAGPGIGAASPEALALGERLAREGLPDRDVGACQGCHAPEAGQGRESFPRLAGQHAPYLAAQLRLFASEHPRGGGAFAALMTRATHALEADEIEAVAAWYAAQPPAPR